MNWKFWSKPNDAPPVVKAPPPTFDWCDFYNGEMKRFSETFYLGFAFVYLSRTMLVRRYIPYYETQVSILAHINVAHLPTLVCEYANNDGDIKEITFEYEFWKVLKTCVDEKATPK